jgi:hypothetical protein
LKKRYEKFRAHGQFSKKPSRAEEARPVLSPAVSVLSRAAATA